MNHEQKQIVVSEHFWFTATIIGVNGLVFSSLDKVCITNNIIYVLGALNLFTFHLVLDRSASYARGNSLEYSEKYEVNYKGKEYLAVIKERARLTFWEIKQSIIHIPFIVVELGSSLFYLLLILFSFLGVYFTYINQCSCCK